VSSEETCAFINQYGTGSFEGYLVIDEVGIGNMKVKANFGAILETGSGVIHNVNSYKTLITC
jgi:hypothetical protein